MKNSKLTNKLYVLAGFFIAIIVAGLIFVAIEQTIQSLAVQSTPVPNQASATNTASSSPYAVLSPATVPSKTAECSTPISFASNGTSGPITCSNGDLNIKEWKALATVEPSVMTLGYSPSLSQVEAAICTDVRNTRSDSNTNYASLIEANVYNISKLYYGWSFSTNPISILSSGQC